MLFLVLLGLGSALPLPASEEGSSARTREKIASSLKDFRKNLQEFRKGLSVRDKAKQDSEKALAEYRALEDEKERALQEYRLGYFCSKCDRSKSQILRETNDASFEAHLGRVKGKRIGKTFAQLQEKRRWYDERIQKLRTKWLSHDNRYQEAVRQISNYRTRVGPMARSLEDLRDEEKRRHSEEHARFRNQAFLEETRIQDLERDMKALRKQEVLAEVAFDQARAGRALERIPGEGRLAVLQARESFHAAQRARLQKESQILEAQKSLRKQKDAFTNQKKARLKKLAGLDGTLKELVRQDSALKGGYRGPTWLDPEVDLEIEEDYKSENELARLEYKEDAIKRELLEMNQVRRLASPRVTSPTARPDPNQVTAQQLDEAARLLEAQQAARRKQPEGSFGQSLLQGFQKLKQKMPWAKPKKKDPLEGLEISPEEEEFLKSLDPPKKKRPEPKILDRRDEFPSETQGSKDPSPPASPTPDSGSESEGQAKDPDEGTLKDKKEFFKTPVKLHFQNEETMNKLRNLLQEATPEMFRDKEEGSGSDSNASKDE